MKSLMSQVYELTNLALLTPQNLVENIQINNYLEIKYYKNNGYIICEMLVEDASEQVKYMYCFNMKNQLQRIIAMCDNEDIELFDRSKELQGLLDEYDNKKKEQIA